MHYFYMAKSIGGTSLVHCTEAVHFSESVIVGSTIMYHSCVVELHVYTGLDMAGALHP